MGYRARYILETARMVRDKPGGGREWLDALRNGASDELDSSVEETEKPHFTTGGGIGVIIKAESTGHQTVVVESTHQTIVKTEPDANIEAVDSITTTSSATRKRKVKAEVAAVKSEHPLDTPSYVSTSTSSRQSVISSLLEFPGVGPKVADCIALFSLDRGDTVPVDTHVWSIAARDYAPELRLSKNLNQAVYESIGRVFRERFGVRAGWAHSVLFAAELPAFRKLLPVGMQEEMRLFAEGQREVKKERREESEANKRVKLEKSKRGDERGGVDGCKRGGVDGCKRGGVDGSKRGDERGGTDDYSGEGSKNKETASCKVQGRG
jgi:hypothetical protein